MQTLIRFRTALKESKNVVALAGLPHDYLCYLCTDLFSRYDYNKLLIALE